MNLPTCRAFSSVMPMRKVTVWRTVVLAASSTPP